MKYPKIDRILLLGGGDTLTQLATHLKGKGRDVIVVTSPRHLENQLITTPISQKAALAEGKVKYLVTEDIGADTKVTSLITPTTMALSFGAAWIFKKDFIDCFGGKLLNSHGARLPLDRGGGFLSWSIMRGDRISCHLIHEVTPGIDDGPVIFAQEFTYPHGCRIVGDYFRYYIEENTKFILDFIAKVDAGTDFFVAKQPDYLGTYWPRLNTAQQGWINWSWSLPEIEAFICAFDDPYAGASTLLNEDRVHLKKVYSVTTDGTFHPFQRGIIYRKAAHAIYVACKEGGLGIGQVLNTEGKDIKSTLKLGDRLTTPSELLDEAMQFRPVYSPKSLKKAA